MFVAWGSEWATAWMMEREEALCLAALLVVDGECRVKVL